MLDRTNKRYKDGLWQVPSRDDGNVSFEAAQLCVLMDIRDELKRLNGKLECYRVARALEDLHSCGLAARRKPKRKQ